MTEHQQDSPQLLAPEVWARHHWGAKHLDQAAGFLWWCRRHRHLRYSSVEWTRLLAEFNATRVGG